MANILLIEPDIILGKAYSTALQRVGHSVRLSRYAEGAVRDADEQKPDLVLLELQLPAHSGVEFLHEFRSYPEWQQIPVIILSLVSPQRLTSQLRHFTQLGVAQYLYKPATTLAQLVRSIADVLEPA